MPGLSLNAILLIAERLRPRVLSAAEKLPHSTMVLKMRSRRISKSLTWPSDGLRDLAIIVLPSRN